MKRITNTLLAILIATAAFAQGTQNFIDQPYIEVTGSAKLDIIPDEIYLSIEIKDSDTKGKQSLESLEKKMIQAFQNIGVDVSEDLTILDFSSNFKNYWLKKSDIFGSKKYQLIVHSGKMLGSVFQETNKLGISNISIIKTDHSNIEKYKQEVKIKAIKAAKVKADNLAQAIGQKAGKAIFIQERNYRTYKREYANTTMKVKGFADMEEAPLPEIEFEKIILEYEIFTRFILE
ncbi:DUF541 domain-containing protein [Labilibacter sediminis]|nr:DUF541 domain-containing protein [Labilibacter sediminis]